MVNFRDLDLVPANNVDDYPEGMARNLLNDKSRNDQARMRGFAEELPWFEFSDSVAYDGGTTFTCAGDQTHILQSGRRVRAIGSTTGDIQGTIQTSVYNDPNTLCTVAWDSGALVNETLNVYVAVTTSISETKINTQPIGATHSVLGSESGLLFLITATAAQIDMNLPTPQAGLTYHFKRLDATAQVVQVVPAGAENIDGVAGPLAITKQYEEMTLVSNGTDWFITFDARSLLDPGDVNTAAIQDGAVTEPKIGAKAVSTGKMADGTPGAYVGYNQAGNAAEVNPVLNPGSVRVLGLPINGNSAVNGSGTQAWLMADNSIMVCGTGTDRVNGSQDTFDQGLPTRVAGLPAKAIRKLVGSSQKYFVVYEDGDVYGWGSNDEGALGIGTFGTTSIAVAQKITVPACDDVVCTYDHYGDAGDTEQSPSSFFLTKTGDVYSCGDNRYGQLGHGDTLDLNIPTQITGLSNVVQLSVAGQNRPHVLARTSTGALYSWGNNDEGQLGIGNTTEQHTPQLVGLTSVTWVQAIHAWGAQRNGFSLALRDNAGTIELWAWGNNDEGQLGQNDRTQRTSPIQVTFTGNPEIVEVSGGGGGEGVCIARTTADGGLTHDVWTWGNGAYGALGNGSTADKLEPGVLGATWSADPTKVKVLGGGRYVGCFILCADGTLWAAGRNNHGQLGVGTNVDQNTFAQVLGAHGVTITDMYAHGWVEKWGLMVLTADGRALGTGWGEDGQLGINFPSGIITNYNITTLVQPIGFSQGALTALPNPRGDWATATGYQHGDLVSAGQGNQMYYIAIQAHTSTVDTEPDVGAQWQTVWALIGQVLWNGTHWMMPNLPDGDPGVANALYRFTSNNSVRISQG